MDVSKIQGPGDLEIAARFARKQLREWMRDHGEDFGSQEAIKAIDAALAAPQQAVPAPSDELAAFAQWMDLISEKEWMRAILTGHRDVAWQGWQARAALAQPAVQDKWQPMETAPTDGTEVLLYLGAPWSRVELARWYAPWGNWQASGDVPDPLRGEYCGIGSELPTHWQPLPAAPGSTA